MMAGVRVEDGISFGDMKLRGELLQGIQDFGLHEPTEVQQQAIPAIFKGNDVIIHAPVKSGRAEALAIGFLQRLDLNIRGNGNAQALILTPTNEEALHIRYLFTALGDYMDVICHALVEGTNRKADILNLAKGQLVVVGTPIRVLEMINSKDFDLKDITMFALDEAGVLLTDSRTATNDIMNKILNTVQVVILSANMGDVLHQFASGLNNPTRISVEAERLDISDVKQYYIQVEKEEWKVEMLGDLFGMGLYEKLKSVIFVNSVRKVVYLIEKMKLELGLDGLAISEDMEMKDREVILESFLTGPINVLVTDDFAVRGLDVSRKDLVIINYDLGNEMGEENYPTRIAGHRASIMLITRDDERFLSGFETENNVLIHEFTGDINDLI